MKEYKQELNEKALENVNGGCIFFHTWRYTGNKRRVIEQDDTIRSYGQYWEFEYKCQDCGDIEWSRVAK